MHNTIIDQKQMMPISMIQTHQIVKLVEIRSGKDLRNHLYSLGFIIGEKIEVLQNDYKAPLLVKIKGSKIAIGKGAGHKILVR